MATTVGYTHKKFDTDTGYVHKKFGQRQNKRKHDEICEDVSTISKKIDPTVATILAEGKTSTQLHEEQPPKRRQTKELFRPWLQEDDKVKATSNFSTTQSFIKDSSHIVQYHSTKVRSFPAKERSPKEQQRRNRNTLSCLLNRRAKKIENVAMEQQYIQLRLQQEAVAQETLRSKLYLQELMKMAVARNSSQLLTPMQQQQCEQQMRQAQMLFVFGNN